MKMGEILSYSIISGFLMLVLYLAYRLLLAKDNQHSFNRTILLLIYLLSFTVSPFSFSLGNIIGNAESQIISFNDAEAANADISAKLLPLCGSILIWIYLAGMIVVAAKTIITWFRLTNVIRSGKKIPQNGYTLIVIDNDDYAPFSWMRYVVVSRNDYVNNCSEIVTHELKHVACHHWIDLLIAQIVCIINWFNPTAWFMRDELILVHEYQADMAVIDSGLDVQEYQMLLIKKTIGARFPSLVNSLSHCKLKKRITMMYKERNAARSKFKALVLMPVLAIALGLTGIPAVRAVVSAISSSEVYANNLTVSEGSFIPEDMEIYLDGEKITTSALKEISPEKIASMTVDKQDNAIRIITK